MQEAFERDADVPLFGVSGVGQASSAHHEPVQDASAFGRYAAERGQGSARPQTGAHRAPAQDGSLFGGQPAATDPAASGPVYSRPGRNPDAQGHGLFGAGPAPTGAHRAPADGGSPPNGRPGSGQREPDPHRAPGTNGASAGESSARGVNGTARDSAVPTQRAGTEASGPSYQQAAGEARRRSAIADSASTPFGSASSGASAGGDTAQPSYGRPGAAGREASRFPGGAPPSNAG